MTGAEAPRPRDCAWRFSMKTASFAFGRTAALAALSAACAAALAASCRAESADGEFLEAAKSIGLFLESTARKDGDSSYWAHFEGGPPGLSDEKRQYPVSFYSGLAGVVHFLLNLHRATGDGRFLKLAAAAGRRLVAQAKPDPKGGSSWSGTCERNGRTAPDGDGPGLYSGNAGIALALQELAAETSDGRFAKAAKSAIERIAADAAGGTEAGGAPWTGYMDLIAGEAGIGLALLRMHELTGDKDCLRLAGRAAAWLSAKSQSAEGAVWWNPYGHMDACFSHGTSGIAFFLALVEGAPAGGRVRKAASWVESAAKPAGDGGLEWEYYAGPPPQGKANWVMNSWCHGAPGTVRLYLLLHRLTGERSYLDVASRGCEGIRSEAKMRSGKPFFHNPSYCCGAAGCMDAFLDLYAATGEARFLDDARLLGREILSGMIPAGKGSGHPVYDEADQAAKKHPYFETGFMTGNSGIGFALLKLWALASRSDAKLLEWPDSPAAGRTPVKAPARPPAQKAAAQEYVVATHVAPDDPYYKAAERIAGHRKAPIIAFNPSDLDPLMAEIARLNAGYVCVIVKPDVVDTNFVRRFLMASTSIDPDPFQDFSFGYVTGEDAGAALRFVENMMRAEKEGLPRRVLRSFVTSACSAAKDNGPSWLRKAGYSVDSLGFGYEDRSAAEKFVKSRLADLQGRGLIHMTGCGDPERIWLFSDSRNCDASKHWKFDPAKVGRNPDGGMFWIDAAMIRGLNLYPAVLTSGTCHCGSLDRVFVEGDIVSTFGTSDKVERYGIPKGRSLGLAYISAGVTAAILPVGPNHGWRVSVEVLRMFQTGAPLGDVVKRSSDELVLAYGGKIALGLYGDDGEEADRGIHEIMRGGAANRVLYGDPAFAPFAKIAGLESPVVRCSEAARTKGMTVEAEVAFGMDYGELYGSDCLDQYTDFKSKLLFEAPLAKERFPHGVASVALHGDPKEGAAALVNEIRWAVETCRSGLVLHAGAFSAKDTFHGGLGSAAGQKIRIAVVPASNAGEAAAFGSVLVSEIEGLVEAALSSPWHYEWNSRKFCDILEFIQDFLEKHGGGRSLVKFEFDESAMPAREKVVTLKLVSEPLRAGIDRLAKELGLEYSVDSKKNVVRFRKAK